MASIITAHGLNLWYGDFKALKGISLDVGEQEITALIGPSGCGKSTFLKTLNRMNDLVPNVRIEGDVRLRGEDIFSKEMQLTDLRRRVGMVFQKANPFPMSIYDNITYGPKLHGVRNKAELDELVESSLRGAALWDEVKDRLKKSALGLSGGAVFRLRLPHADPPAADLSRRRRSQRISGAEHRRAYVEPGAANLSLSAREGQSRRAPAAGARARHPYLWPSEKTGTAKKTLTTREDP